MDQDNQKLQENLERQPIFLPIQSEWLPLDKCEHMAPSPCANAGKMSLLKERRLNRRRHAITSLHASPACSSIHSDARRLIRAVSRGDRRTLSDFLKSGVDPSIADERGRTALHVASAKGDDVIVYTLLKNGADVNKVDGIGNTPLHLAACSNSADVMEMLVDAGCRIEAQGRTGFSPVDYIAGRLKVLQRDPHAVGVVAELHKIIKLLKSLQRRQHRCSHASWNEMPEILETSDSQANVSQANVGSISDLLDKISLITTDEPVTSAQSMDIPSLT